MVMRKEIEDILNMNLSDAEKCALIRKIVETLPKLYSTSSGLYN